MNIIIRDAHTIYEIRERLEDKIESLKEKQKILVKEETEENDRNIRQLQKDMEDWKQRFDERQENNLKRDIEKHDKELAEYLNIPWYLRVFYTTPQKIDKNNINYLRFSTDLRERPTPWWEYKSRSTSLKYQYWIDKMVMLLRSIDYVIENNISEICLTDIEMEMINDNR